MSLRATASVSNKEKDEPPSSKSKTRSFFAEKGLATSTIMRGAGVLLASTMILGVSYGSMVASGGAAISSVTHENIRRRQATDGGVTQCTIWMAPSSLKGLDGYGIFTTRDIQEGSSIFTEPDGPSIPIIDYNKGPWLNLWYEYVWARGVSDQVSFLGHKVMDFQIGGGSLPNHHCILNSLSHRYYKPDFDDSLVSRSKDPGAGAFSHSMGRDFYAMKELKAGDEIFLNYGYCKREQRNNDDWTSFIPMKEDYAEAANLAWAYLQLPKDAHVRVTIPKGTNKFVASLLPRSTKHLRDIVGSNEIHDPDDLVPLLAQHLAVTPRSPEWIRGNGICLEHLSARKSLLPHAGQGGFSKHFIRKGEIVVPAPMIHMIDKSSLIVYDDNDKPVSWQLLLNYCFGHGESTMLLCPDTNALLINHCSDRKKECGPEGPNAIVQWSSGWEPRSEVWRKMSLIQIQEQSGRGLSMEIIALRDIEPGEEVFLDYGESWEQAWEEHVATWKPPVQDDEYTVTAKEANEQGDSLELLVTGDLRKVSDHPYLFTGCQYWPSKEDDSKYYRNEYPHWEEMDDKDILRRFADSGRHYKGRDYAHHSDKTYWPCSVIREESSGFYVVRIHQVDREHDMEWHKNNVPRLLQSYPRESIHYFVKPYASDQNLHGAFRHPIGLRDEIFPAQWKNLVVDT